MILRPLLIGLALVAGGTAARAEDCLKTYDRSGAVVGRYCGEGLVEPSGGTASAAGRGRTAQTAPMAQDPGPAPDSFPGGKTRSKHGPRAPKDVQIRCSQAQKAAGQRCTGVFDLSL